MYTDEQVRQAYFGDELARIQAENSAMFAFSNSRVPSYGTAVPDPEATLADLDDETVDGAITELAAQRGVSITELGEQILTLTGGERDLQSRAMAVAELAAMPPDEAGMVLDLAAKGKKPKPVDDAEDEEDDMSDEDIEDMSEHMAEHQGNEGPKPGKPRKKKRATRPVQVKRRGQQPFGGEGGAPVGGEGASGTGEGGSMAASAPRRALVRAGRGYETVALSEDQEWADEEIARLAQEHPGVGLSAPVFDTPNDLGGPVRHFPFPIHDVGTRDDDQTKPSDDALAEVQRYLWIHKSMSKPKAYGAVTKGKLAGKYPGTGPSGKPQNIAS